MAVVTYERTINKKTKELETDVEYYTRLSKMADQRLVRLEKASQTEVYSEVREYAYKTAQRHIAVNTGRDYNPSDNDGKLRFNIKALKGDNVLTSIRHVKEFLESASSTIGDVRLKVDGEVTIQSGIRDVYERRANTLNHAYGTNFTWDNLATFFENARDKVDKYIAGSDSMFRAIGIIQSDNLLDHNFKKLKSDTVGDIRQYSGDKAKFDKFVEELKRAEDENNKKLIADIRKSIRENLKFSNDNVADENIKKLLYKSGLKKSDLY